MWSGAWCYLVCWLEAGGAAWHHRAVRDHSRSSTAKLTGPCLFDVLCSMYSIAQTDDALVCLARFSLPAYDDAFRTAEICALSPASVSGPATRSPALPVAPPWKQRGLQLLADRRQPQVFTAPDLPPDLQIMHTRFGLKQFLLLPLSRAGRFAGAVVIAKHCGLPEQLAASAKVAVRQCSGISENGVSLAAPGGQRISFDIAPSMLDTLGLLLTQSCFGGDHEAVTGVSPVSRTKATHDTAGRLHPQPACACSPKYAAWRRGTAGVAQG